MDQNKIEQKKNVGKGIESWNRIRTLIKEMNKAEQKNKNINNGMELNRTERNNENADKEIKQNKIRMEIKEQNKT